MNMAVGAEKGKRATIKDVARLAGVSTAVVSYVLNDTPGKSVAAETREKVNEAIQLLHYIPNNAARTMRNANTMTVGVVSFYETATWFSFTNIFTELLRGIMNKAKEIGYTVCMAGNNREGNDFEYIRSFVKNQVDGIILVAPPEELPQYDETLHLTKLRETGIPCVVINGRTHLPGIQYIHFDLTQAGFLATEYLMTGGHTDIAFVCDPTDLYYDGTEQRHGYRQCMKYGGLSAHIAEYDHEQTDRLLAAVAGGESPVTAVVTSQSDVAHAILRQAYARGMRIPDRLSVIACNTHAYAEFLFPPLTSIALPMHQIGYRAVDMAVDPRAIRENAYVDVTMAGSVHERASCRVLTKRADSGPTVSFPEDGSSGADSSPAEGEQPIHNSRQWR